MKAMKQNIEKGHSGHKCPHVPRLLLSHCHRRRSSSNGRSASVVKIVKVEPALEQALAVRPTILKTRFIANTQKIECSRRGDQSSRPRNSRPADIEGSCLEAELILGPDASTRSQTSKSDICRKSPMIAIANLLDMSLVPISVDL